jgi:6-phospho-beta-glucosidase
MRYGSSDLGMSSGSRGITNGQLTILGGGGFRVPLIYQALLKPDFYGLIDRIVLYDPDTQRLAAICAVLDQMARRCGPGPSVITTDKLEESLSDADFVFSAIRVGGTVGRVLDERIPLTHGQLGQETVGAGGLLYGLRTVPVMESIAETVRRVAPDAWLINLTNPAGLVTQAMGDVLGDRVIGVCDSPTELCHHVASALEIEMHSAFFDYFGLNHLGWLRGVYVNGRERLAGLLEDKQRMRSMQEVRLFGEDWIRALGMIPNEYLFYYYKNSEAIKSITSNKYTRGQFIREQQSAFYDEAVKQPEDALERWQAAVSERDFTYMAESRAEGEARSNDVQAGGGYAEAALSVVRAIARNSNDVQILNVRNRSALPLLPADAVVEVPCLVSGNGAVPLSLGGIPNETAGMMLAVEAAQRLTIDAARTQSWELALRAVAAHPLVSSVSAAEEILGRYRAELPRLLASQPEVDEKHALPI